MEDHAHFDVPKGRAWRFSHVVLLGVVLVGWLGLSGINVWMGELNQDEGWYLYAARQMAEGQIPYRDFAYTQPPMLPLVYALANPWLERFGLLGGRGVTWAFGAMGLLCASWLAMRVGPRGAQRFTGGLCFIVVALNVYQSYFTTVVKTYSLASFFLASGLLALSFVGPTKGFRAAMASGFLLACAAATRISLLAALAMGVLYLLVFRRRVKAWAWLDFALGGALGLALTVLPFAMLGRDGFRFGVIEYHSLREAGSVLSQMAFKVGCLSRLVQAYFPAVVGVVCLWVLGAARRSRSRERVEAVGLAPNFVGFLWCCVGVLALVHVAAPFPYDDYQVPIYPLLCAALAASLARGCQSEVCSSRRLVLLVMVLFSCVLYSFASPLTQSWGVAGRDRIWWRLRAQSPVAQLRDVAKWVRELNEAEGGTHLLTQDIYLAVEAGLPVPRGFGMGPFSYYPDWSRERAQKIGVMNRDMLLEVLATQTNAPIAALSGYSLTIRSPEVVEVSREDHQAFDAIFSERFDRVEVIPGFGQAGTDLVLWRLKKELPEPKPSVEKAEK